MRSKHLRILVSFVFVLTALSPLVQPVGAPLVDPGGKPPSGGMESEGGGGESASSYGDAYLPSSQTLVNGTQAGGDCGSAWTFLNGSDDLRCSYTEADKSPLDQSVVLLPDGTDTNGWAASGCSTDSSPWDELDDGPDTNDGDTTCRQGSTNGNRVGVTLQNPSWTDAADIDDFTVTSSAVVKKVSSSSAASIGVDMKVGASSYNNGATQATTTSYVRYSRVDTTNPISGQEWTTTDINDLRVATRCVDCSPNNRATQAQARVDAVYNAEYALEVRFQWSGIPTQADGWYLVAECQRLGPEGENVTIQVGQGGSPPTVWKEAFWCLSDSDDTFDPYPLNATEVNGGSPFVRIWDARVDSPDDVTQATMALDVLRLDVAPWANGLAHDSYRQPLNISGDYANKTVVPVLDLLPSGYTYVTSYGNYTFPAASPYLFSMSDWDRRESANASTFVVEGTPATAISGAYVAWANNTTFRVIYNVTSGPTFQGTMDIETSFSAEGRPKMTAIFSRDPAATITNWWIRWKVVTTDHYLQMPGDTTLDFGAYGMLTQAGADPTEAVIGPLATPALWNSTLIANWSDAGTGMLKVGPVSIDAGHSGQGFVVDFPPGVAAIDPSMVAKSTTSWATRYTNQKKVFYHGGSYFAFFRSSLTVPNLGTVELISYSSGRESGESPSGMVWDSPTAVVAGYFKWSFDVDHRNGVVALVWVDINDVYGVVLGTVSGSSIVWRSTWASWDMSYSYVPSIAIASDGFVWVALPGHMPGVESLKLVLALRSSVPEGIPALLSTSIPTNDIRETVRLVPVAGGDVMLLRAPYASPELYWYTYQAVSDSWALERSTSGLGLKPNSEKVSTWTAVGDSDVEGNQVARLLYIDGLNPPRLKRHTVYAYDCPFTGYYCNNYVEIDSGTLSYPAVQVDVNGDLHHFWSKQGTGCSNCRRIYYQWVNRTGTTSGIMQPFAPSTPTAVEAIHLSTGFGTQLNRAFLVYTDNSAAGVRVYFASVPTRRAVGGSGSTPWDRPGISPHGTYFQQLDEFVSPGNGLLYVRQTDLSAPGRGLDLAIQRLYRTPDAFSNGNPPSVPPAPWGFDAPSGYSLGRGWSLNLPFLTQEYVYLWDGQRYPISWDWNVFENREGEFFRLVRGGGGYADLYMRSGVSYRFWNNQLISISDTNSNQIQLSYSGARLELISDSVGRFADLDYTPTAYCPGSTVTPARVCKITYTGRTSQYRYTDQRLDTVIDALGRLTTYSYCSSGCVGVTNDWLMRQVRYPTGARSEYEWTSVKVGTDTSAYAVTKQLLRDSSGQVVRKKTFDIVFVNGAGVNVLVTHYDGPGVERRSERHMLDPVKGNAISLQLDASRTKRNGQRMWYGSGGRIVQNDAFAGTTATENLNPTYVTYADYDGSGNLIYARSATGSETLSSYVNSDYHGAFYAPGRLELVAPPPGQSAGRVWTEDFRDYAYLDWQLSSGGNKVLDDQTFGSLPPSLKLETAPTPGQAWAKHTYAQQSPAAGFVVSVLVKPGTSDRVHDLKLTSAGIVQVYVRFDSDGLIRFPGGPSQWPSYVGGTWYQVTVEVLPAPNAGRYNLYINGVFVTPGSFQYTGSGSFDGIEFWAGAPSATITTTMWVNEVSVFTGRTLTIQDIQGGLEGGTRVRAISAVTGRPLDIKTVVSGSATITLPPHSFPRVFLQILDAAWSPIYTSPTREFWGGSTLRFVEPRLVSAITKTGSGFLRPPLWTWVDDSTPSGTETSDPDEPPPNGEGGWSWSSANSANAASLQKYHESRPMPGRHGHGFRDGSTTPLPGVDDYWVQYVYAQPSSFPAEILRAFQHSSTGSYFRAYWGADLARLAGGYNKAMGSIPGVTDRWMMLIVRQRDLQDNPNGPANSWKGASYYVVGGGARWDFTVRGDPQTGVIRVSGLPPGTGAGVYDIRNNIVAWAYESGGIANIDVYQFGFWAAFPARGYFKLWNAAGNVFARSPVLDLFGGDQFQYTTSDFYVNDDVNYQPPGFLSKDRLAGLYRVQERDASGAPSVTQTTYFRYDSRGNPIETRVVGPNGPVVTSLRTYPQLLYGNVETASSLYDDSSMHTTTYAYDSASPFFSAYLTSVSDTVGGTPIATAFGYTSGGELTSVAPPVGGGTAYAYDAAGRPLTVTHPDGTVAGYEYYDSANLVKVKDENQKSETLRPNGAVGQPQWSRAGCSNNWECVDEDPYDGSTYVFSWTTGDTDTYTVTPPMQAFSNPIASVTVTAVAMAVPGDCPARMVLEDCAFASLYLMLNGQQSPLKYVRFEWGTLRHTWTSNPATGLPWTVGDLSTLQVGIRNYENALSETWVTQLYVEVGQKRQTWQCFDSIGRLVKVYRFDDLGPPVPPTCGVITLGFYSVETYAYDWEDRILSHTMSRGPGETARTWWRSYDFQGRLTHVTNPDLTTVDIAYDDVTNTKTVTVPTPGVQNARRLDYIADRDGRLTTVKEWIGATPYTTTYSYDEAGNLKKATTPADGTGYAQETSHEYDTLGRLIKTTYPDGPNNQPGTNEQYGYLNSGLLKWKLLRDGERTTYAYDELRRLNWVCWDDTDLTCTSGEADWDYDYDENGNLKKLTFWQPGQSNPVITEYTYVLARGWVDTEKTTTDGNVWRTVDYDYDNVGNVVRVRVLDASGTVHDVQYAYDAMDRVCAVAATAPGGCSPSSYYAKLSHYANDALDTITYETGTTDVTTKYTYGLNGWPSAIETKKGTTTHLRMDYEAYDTLGNPLRIKHSGSVSTTYECFTYDALNRLAASNTATSSTCVNAAGAWSWNLAYTYDALGNRLSVLDGSTTTYRYDSYSRLCWTKIGTPPACTTTSDSSANRYVYDSRGEVTQRVLLGQSWGFAYDLEGKLTAASGPSFSASYVYDGLGRRVKSVINGVTNAYVYSGLSVIYESNPATKYVFADGARLAKITGTTTEFYHYDHLGNVRLVTSGTTGNVAATIAYKPFGLPVVVTGSERPYGYTGEYREAAPNLFYLHSRWYDPTIGRFLSADDRLGRQSMPQDQNRYAYVVNNPMVYTDPTGRVIPLLLIFLAVVLVSATVNTAVYAVTCGDSCSLGGYVGAFVGGAVAGAIGYFTAGWGFWGVMAAGALANAAAYTIAAAATGTFTWEGLFVAGVMGALLAGFGYGVGKAVGRFLHRPPNGMVAEGGSKIAMEAQPADEAAKAVAHSWRKALSLQRALPGRTAHHVTMAAGVAEQADGSLVTLVASSERGLRKGVAALLQPDDIIVRGIGHAEARIVTFASDRGWRLLAVSSGRPHCVVCLAEILELGAVPVTP